MVQVVRDETHFCLQLVHHIRTRRLKRIRRIVLWWMWRVSRPVANTVQVIPRVKPGLMTPSGVLASYIHTWNPWNEQENDKRYVL